MRFVFANAGGVAPPKQHQRALASAGANSVLFSYYYLLLWDDEWLRTYIATGDAFANKNTKRKKP